MKLLALDPATKMGWALMGDGAVIASGTWDLSVRRDESGGMRLIRLRSKLAEMAPEGIDLLVYEAARNCAPRMQGALVVQAELQAVIKTYCIDAGWQFRGYSPTEIKRHATGKGNANKAKMMDAARAKWPYFKGDDNEADALWLADLAWSEVGAALPTRKGPECQTTPPWLRTKNSLNSQTNS